MSCSIIALLTCFHLSGFYVDGGLAWSNYGEGRIAYESGPAIIENKEGVIVTSRYKGWYLHDEAQNPYGRLALGYSIDFKQVQWRLEANHVSSIDTARDHGFTMPELKMEWRPFAKL